MSPPSRKRSYSFLYVLFLVIVGLPPLQAMAQSVTAIKGYKLIVGTPCQGFCEWNGLTPDDAVNARIADSYAQGNTYRYTTWCDVPSPVDHTGRCYWRDQSGRTDGAGYKPFTFCPPGYTLDSQGLCAPNGSDPLKTGACPAQPTGNPCDPASGNKYESEVDRADDGQYLALQRHFNSIVPGYSTNQSAPLKRFAKLDQAGRWRFGLDRSLTVHITAKGSTALVSRGNGKGYYFTLTGGNWISDGDVRDTLMQTAEGWTYRTSTGQVEVYQNYTDPISAADVNARVIAVTDTAGRTTTYDYDAAGRLATIVGPHGHTLRIL